MADLTRERVDAAYGALMTGDRDKILEFWDENLRFEMPGHHQFSGWYNGLDDYLSKMSKLGEAHGGRFSATTKHVLILPEAGVSIDIYELDGYRPGAEEGTTSPTTGSRCRACTCCAGRTAGSSRAAARCSGTGCPAPTCGGPR